MNSKAVTYISTPVAASTKFNNGDLICIDTNGRAAVPADTSGFVYGGSCGDDVADNSSGAAGAINTKRIPPGRDSRYKELTLTGATQASVGKVVYFTGPTTVATSSSNNVRAGIVEEYITTNLVLVDTLR